MKLYILIILVLLLLPLVNSEMATTKTKLEIKPQIVILEADQCSGDCCVYETADEKTLICEDS